MSDETTSPSVSDTADHVAGAVPPPEPTPAVDLPHVLLKAMAAMDRERWLTLALLAQRYIEACEAEKRAEDEMNLARALVDRTLLEMRAVVSMIREEGARG